MANANGPTRISQVAMVVRDLDASMKMFHDTLGWGPWNVYEHVPPKLHHTHLRGKDVAFSMLGAECEVQPGLVFELVQPLDGPSIYKEFLEEHGATVLMGGRIGETIEFYYLDTEPMLKFILESGSGHAIDLTPSRVYPPA